MPGVEVKIDGKDFEGGLRELAKLMDIDDFLGDAEVVAQEIIRRSIDAPIPSDTRFLANSSTVNRGKNEVTFGFNARYAAFQDSLDGKSDSMIIKPKKKQALYIPLTPKGKLHRYCTNPEDEGLVKGVDYVLAKQVTIHMKPYGSAIGPNRYFSGTLTRNVDFMFETIALRASRRIGRKFKFSRGKV